MGAEPVDPGPTPAARLTAAPAAPGTSPSAHQGPSMRTRVAVLLLCLLGGPLLAEGVLRFLIFHPSELAARWGSDLRKPGLYADDDLEDEYWRLEWLLRADAGKTRTPPYDELLGWTNRRVEPRTYRYLPEVELHGRRPVLLYGASFTDCVTGPEECFETLMEQSPLSEQFALLNYGIGGYGCGQVLTLMRETLDRYGEQRPVVVIGLVADSDYTRCSLGFRSWPKLRLVRRGGALVPSEAVPAGGPALYLESRGTGIRSYAWRYLLHAPSQLPPSWQRKLRGAAQLEAEQDALIGDIVRAMRDELEARGFEYFFLLNTSPRSLPPAQASHQESLLLELFEREGIPCAAARPYLLRAAGEHPEAWLGGLFVQEGPKRNHPNLAGNRVLFEALTRGLQGELEPPPE